jgi:hypothetical protein
VRRVGECLLRSCAMAFLSAGGVGGINSAREENHSALWKGLVPQTLRERRGSRGRGAGFSAWDRFDTPNLYQRSMFSSPRGEGWEWELAPAVWSPRFGLGAGGSPRAHCYDPFIISSAGFAGDR